ncbi:hypothetical protein [Martelella mangrovi]|uniref:DUF4747 domain-containing protein n=1 Tax=Martelella mangrovi TaxID=1397477 RepID=A0ABV2IGY5_9HYPH
MRVFLFRFSLKQRQQRELFERTDSQGQEYTRETWLREKFSKEFKFVHRSNEFFFVPEASEITGIPTRLIVGWVARNRAMKERTAPWDGLDPTEHESWQAALIMIDPTDHADGQKVAMESRPEVGNKPEAILASLAKHISDESPNGPFAVSAFPITIARSFMSFVEENKDKISSITYDVAVPNMFNGTDDFSEEMRNLRDNANISRVKTNLSSEGVITTEGTHLAEIAVHAEQGGGNIKARTIDDKTYNSDDYAASEDVDMEGTEPETPSYWKKIRSFIDKIF